MLCHAGSTDIPDPLFATFPYRSSPQAGLLDNIPYAHIVAECVFVLVVPAFARPCVGVHKNTSLTSSSLLLQPCPACLVRLTWIVFVIGGRWPYSWCLVGCCPLGTCSRLLAAILCNCRLASSPAGFVRVHVVHPYSSIDVTAAWKKLRFILSVRSDFHIIDSLLIVVPCFR